MRISIVHQKKNEDKYRLQRKKKLSHDSKKNNII